MNAGLSNLATLKAHLLAPAIAATTKYDAIITDLGLGLARALESWCGRKLARVVGAQEIFRADQVNFLLSRFPIETLTTVELKLTEAAGWVTQTSGNGGLVPNLVDLANGLIVFPDGADCGQYYSQLRFTFTGGFFWEQLEPGAGGYPTAVPTGANVLPDDLKFAWLLQCRHVWSSFDKLGTALVEKPNVDSALADLKLAPEVKQMLTNYLRYSMV